MSKDELIQATEKAQSIITSTPREELEDFWVEFSPTIDINIWFEDGPIKATAYPIKTHLDGHRYTDVDYGFAELAVQEAPITICDTEVGLCKCDNAITLSANQFDALWRGVEVLKGIWKDPTNALPMVEIGEILENHGIDIKQEQSNE